MQEPFVFLDRLIFSSLPNVLAFLRQVSLRPYTTLRAGGPAELFVECWNIEELAQVAEYAHEGGHAITFLGAGSNILPSDQGVPGITAVNRANSITISGDQVVADAGCSFQELFLKTAQVGLGGLEFAVGIPGSLGGALVSNAGAYRSNVSEFLTELEIVEFGQRKSVGPEKMEFAYRDSILRRSQSVSIALLQAKMTLPRKNQKDIYDEAREYQRQRISKQPAPASAGSFFKNVYSQELADSLDNLPERLRAGGVVPAGYLIEKAGLKGYRHNGAMFGARHANFVLNVGNANATSIRQLAEIGKRLVLERFKVTLEEEVLYLGDWSSWNSPRP